MNTLRLCNRGHFAGKFAITTDTVTYSIGDRIQVRQTGDMYQTGVTITDSRPLRGIPIFALPLLVNFCCPQGALEVELQGPSSRTFQHWMHCLNREDYVEVLSLKMTSGRYDWYVPVIDGWIYMMTGRARAPAWAYRRVTQ